MPAKRKDERTYRAGGDAMNMNPVKARLAKRGHRYNGDLPRLQKKLWKAVEKASEIMATGGDDTTTLRAIHALAQVTGAFIKVVETGELEARLEALEAQKAA